MMGAWLPRLRPEVALVPVLDEAVLYDERGGDLHRLDPIAAHLCARLDPSLTVAQFVELLHQQFGAPQEMIRQDVVGFLEHLAQLDLVIPGARNHVERVSRDGLPATAEVPSTPRYLAVPPST